MSISNKEFLPRVWEISGTFLNEVTILGIFVNARIQYNEEELQKISSVKIQQDPILYQQITDCLKGALDEASGKRKDELVKVKWGDSPESEYVKEDLIGHFERRTMRMQKWLRVEHMQTIVSFNYLLALFDAALADITKYLLQREPSFLQSSNKQNDQEKLISLNELLNANGISEIIDGLVERKVDKLSRGTTIDHIDFLRRCLKTSILPDNISQAEIVEMRSTRNIYTHNKGIVNELYLELVKDSAFGLGELRVITLDYFKECSNRCLGIIQSLNSVITQVYNRRFME
jgi:hypothetical protein